VKILITGSSGLFAREFLKNISAKKNFKIFCITRKKKKNKKNIFFYKIDLSKKMTKKLYFEKKIDYIIHNSFIKMNNHFLKKDIIKKNLLITENLIKIINQIQFKKIINFSSSSLYPNKKGIYSEKSQVNFLKNNDFPYAYSKHKSEQLLNKKIDQNKIIHLRIANIIFKDKNNSILSKIKQKIIKKNEISIYGQGKRILNLIHFNKLIFYIYRIIRKNNLKGVYNISDYSINLKKLTLLIKNKYGNSKTKIIFHLKKNNDQKNIINARKFFTKLNIKKPKIRNLINEI